MKNKIREFLKTLSIEEINMIPSLITEGLNERLLADLQPGKDVITLCSGFSCGAGRRCKFMGFVKQGEPTDRDSVWGDDYATFGDGHRVQWLVTPDKLSSKIKIYLTNKEKE